LEVNEQLVGDTKTALKKVHDKAYADTQELEDTERQFSFEKAFTNDEWVEMYGNGEVIEWIDKVERTFIEIGGLPTYRDPKEFFDPTILTEAAKERGGNE